MNGGLCAFTSFGRDSDAPFFTSKTNRWQLFNICQFSVETRQENDEPEDTAIEEDSHDGHVSLHSLFFRMLLHMWKLSSMKEFLLK